MLFQRFLTIFWESFGRKEKRVVVAFRGTATMKDVLVDMNGRSIFPDEFNFAYEKNLVSKETKLKIHQGFNSKFYSSSLIYSI